MRKRARAHEAGSVEAGSSISKSIFFCLSCRWGSRWGIRLQPNRLSQGAQERTEQPNRASWGTQERQKQPKSAKSEPKAPQDRSKSGQERPKSSPERPKSVQERPKSVPRSPRNAPRTPNRGSQGAQERTEHPNRSNQGDLDETLPLRSEINENTAHAQQNRRPGVPRAARSSLPERPGTTRSAKSSQPGHPEQPDRASRGHIEPARTRQVVRLLGQSTAQMPGRKGWSSNFVIDIHKNCQGASDRGKNLKT